MSSCMTTGHSKTEALRLLMRRICDEVLRRLIVDALRKQNAHKVTVRHTLGYLLLTLWSAAQLAELHC